MAARAGFLAKIWDATGGQSQLLSAVQLRGAGSLPSVFAVSDLASESVAAAGLAISEFMHATGISASPSSANKEAAQLPDASALPTVFADRRLASMWFGMSIRPHDWELPPIWDPIAGDYPTADGWIRLHTNAPHHRAAALKVLGVEGERPAVAAAVKTYTARDLESAVVAAGGCAAEMRSVEQWAEHPQGAAVATEPLLYRTTHCDPIAARPSHWAGTAQRPLAGVRVLDLTRIIAGPTATRFLAAFGADVLRIDPIEWEEKSLEAEIMVGKRCARLDLCSDEGRDQFRALLAKADVLLHGYRADALEKLGLGVEERRRLNPLLVDVCLNAYGWTGPWKDRRGFDSLVQMSSGIADAGMRQLDRPKPTPLPVQALDHATGYVLAAAAVRGLTDRWSGGCGVQVRASLARVAHLLVEGSGTNEWAASNADPMAPETAADRAAHVEQTAWGPAQRVAGPVVVGEAVMSWDHPARPLGWAKAEW